MKTNNSFFSLAVFVAMIILITTARSLAQNSNGSGSALDFDGTDDYVDCGNNLSVQITGTAITMEAWIKPSKIDAHMSIIKKVGAGSNGYELYCGSNARVNFRINGTDASIVYSISLYPTDGTWMHVAATYDGAFNRIYINGRLESSTSYSTIIGSTSNNLFLAKDPSTGTRLFQGSIDECRLWNVVRTEAEIKANMCKKLTGTETGLVGYWRMDETSGTNVNNEAFYYSAYNNGTMMNMDPLTDHVWSGAALGNEAASDYDPEGGYSATITYNTEGTTATTNSGTIYGLQVYRADGNAGSIAPSGYTEDPSGFWGVKAIGISTPTYTLVYDYSGNPGITDENGLKMLKRASHSTAIWTDASAIQDFNANTLTVTGATGTEYALGIPVTYQLIVQATTGGMITQPSSSSATVNHGAATPIIAEASADYTFTGWTVISGSGASIAAPSALSTTVTLTDGAAEVRASFVPSLAGYWKMNEGEGTTLIDASSYGNNGSILGSPVWINGVHGLALALNGFTQYAVVPASASLNITGPITFAAWIKPNSTDLYSIVAKYSGEGNGDAGYEFFLAGTGVVSLRLNGAHRLDSQTPYPTDGSWMHVAAIADGTALKIYINGILDNSAPSTALPLSCTGDAGIGATSSGGKYYNGWLDDVCLYNRALTPAEIAELASHTITAVAGVNGSINPTGSVKVLNNANLQFTITPETGFIVSNLLIDNESVTPSTNYTFLNVVGDHTISVEFAQENQFPAQPVLQSPPDASMTSTSPTLQVAVTDPESRSMTVSFYGRPKIDPGEDFTIIALPDAQNYTAELYGGTIDMFNSQTTWCMNQRETRNIVYVAMEGDITNYNTEQEWIRASTAMSYLESPAPGIPYGIAFGNHDGPPTELYNTYFGSDRFESRNYYGGHYGSTNDNNYALFSASGMDFIVINLGYGTETPDAEVLDWANNLLQNNSARRAIVVSHILISFGNPALWDGPGQTIYDALKENENLFLMLCGHISAEGIRTDTYNGHTVYTILSDYQSLTNGGNGWLRILTFSPANNQITVSSYSPFLLQSNYRSPYVLPYNMTTTNDFQLIGTNTGVASGSTTSISWSGLTGSTEYEWYVTVSNGIHTITGSTWSFTAFGSAAFSGNLNYYNLSSSPLSGVNIELRQGGNKIYPETGTISTDATGHFSFEGVNTGTYDLVFTPSNGPGCINSTDAAQVNYWGTEGLSYPIERVRFKAGDVTGDNQVRPADAGLILQHFLTQGFPTPPFNTQWSFWKTGEEMIGSNPWTFGNLTITVTGSGVSQNFYGLATGDFNRSYIPGSLKSGSESLMLVYGETLEVIPGMEFQLPLSAVMDMEVGAVSLIIDFPSDLLEVNGVYLSDDPGVPLMHAVSGDELRIAWNSLDPVFVSEGESLLTLLVNVKDLTPEEGIRIKLASDPLNELADGNYDVISDAVLSIEIVKTVTTGTGEITLSDRLSLANHPNPFTGKTTFVYSLPVDGKVTLEIYDIVGNKVKSLVDEMQSAGVYQLKIDEKSLQAGVYTATLKLDSNGNLMTRTIKIICKY